MSKMDEFEVVGDASASRTRAAGLLDLLMAAVVGMLIVPQPVVRASLMASGATVASVASFVGVLIAAVFAVYWLYLAFAAVTWGRSIAMYLLDLGLATETKPTLAEACLWAVGWVFAALPAVFGLRVAYDPVRGLPSRWSGARTGATVPR